MAKSMNKTNPDKGIRYLALGDSYTIGEGLTEEGRLPVILAKKLNEHGILVDKPIIIAKTGWTTDELSQAINLARPNGPFDLVSLCIGVNNQYRGRSSQEYAAEFSDLLETAIAFAQNDPGRVFVLSIPDWGYTPFAKDRDKELISKQIDEFNRLKQETCLKFSVEFIDITGFTRQLEQPGTWLASDGLHYSSAMHMKWVDAILESQCIQRLMHHE
jgi:lysophospholipase L1-like esterase